MRKFLYFSKNTKPAFGDMAKFTITHYLLDIKKTLKESQ